MYFQWYPGHMTKALRMMQENIKLIDVVVELVDARIPFSSKNPDIDKLAMNKSRVIILNKVDMADKAVTADWEEYFREKGFFTAKVNSRNGSGLKEVKTLIEEACKEKRERDRKKGIINRPVRAMIVGIPNVGKSTFINSFAGKACAKTGNKPGVTKGKQWIKINKNVELLDTPGILWPKFEDQIVGLKLAFTGSIKEEILNNHEIALKLVEYLTVNYPGVLAKRYNENMDEGSVNADEILMEVAKVRGCLLKQGEYDLEKSALMLLDDFRSVRLGKISLEKPQDVRTD